MDVEKLLDDEGQGRKFLECERQGRNSTIYRQ